MTNKNDEKILSLKADIEKVKEKLAGRCVSFSPITNCLLKLDGVDYNLHVSCDELLLIKLNTLVMSAKDLDIDPSKVMISGFPLSSWMADVQNSLNAKKSKELKRQLEQKEKQLTELLSADKRTELEIESITTDVAAMYRDIAVIV